MIQVDKAPMTGQFVAVWQYEGDVWSGTYLWDDGYFQEYDSGVDAFVENYHFERTAWNYDSEIAKTVKFFVVS